MRLTARPGDVGLSAERLARIGAWMRGYVDAGKLPCAMTLVARRGEVVFFEAQGLADVEAGKPLAADSILRMYSMSKPVTSVAAMMLYEEGRFQLDDPVARFIPGFTDMAVAVSGEGEEIVSEPAREPVTIRHLMTHTSGLIYGFMNETPLGKLYQAEKLDFGHGSGTLEDAVGRLARVPLTSHPGAEWNYGVSTDVLGYLVEVISGERFDRFLAERVLGPLGMADTGFHVPESEQGRFAALYGPTEEGGIELIDPPRASSFMREATMHSGGSGLVSTMGDYHRFCEMLRRKGELDGVRLLGRKTVEYMTLNHLPGDLAAMGQPRFSETSYAGIGFGLGFSVVIDPAKAEVMSSPGEYAWGGAASTAFWIDPVEDLVAIFLTQLLPSCTYPLRRELHALVYQAIID